MTSFDDRVETDAERRCLEELRSITGGAGGVMENHALRIVLLCERMAARRGVEVDREVLACAALLHDVGLYDRASRGGVYTEDGAAFARGVLEPFGWEPARLTLCLEAIARHHELRSLWAHGAEVELVRRADRVDVSGGLLRGGLPREEIQAVFDAVSRKGAYRHIGKLVGRVLLTRPLTLPRVFAPR